jgi:hydroxyacyl-ACP dehydratase HTD2-like protein with hotdog domain
MTYFEDVAVGDLLPPLVVTVDETQMFLFSAATYNGHRIHYDKDWARGREGYDDVLLQGPLQAALLACAVTDWLGGAGRLVTFSVQNRGVAHPGQELTFGGTVTEVDPATGRAGLDLAGRRGDTVLMPGTAVVSLPRRSGGGR